MEGIVDIIRGLNKIQKIINHRLTELHWLYSPMTFYDSKVNFEKSHKILSSSRQHVAVLDRNIFSRLINLITDGRSKQGSTKDIAQLILWCIIHEIEIWPYYALNELAVGENSEQKAQYEYSAFNQMFSKIDIQTWLALALGFEQENETLIESNKEISTIDFNEISVDYLANFAALLHFEYIWRTEKDNIARFKSFFQWYYGNLKESRFITVYVCSVLLGIKGYKLPKKVNSENYDEFILGCKNQAMDVCYLTSLSIDRIPYDKYEFIFVTDDKMLGDIFLEGCFNTHAIRIFEKNIKQGGRQVSEWVNNLLENHVEVNPEDYIQHCRKIIEIESERVKTLF